MWSHQSHAQSELMEIQLASLNYLIVYLVQQVDIVMKKVLIQQLYQISYAQLVIIVFQALQLLHQEMEQLVKYVMLVNIVHKVLQLC